MKEITVYQFIVAIFIIIFFALLFNNVLTDVERERCAVWKWESCQTVISPLAQGN